MSNNTLHHYLYQRQRRSISHLRPQISCDGYMYVAHRKILFRTMVAFYRFKNLSAVVWLTQLIIIRKIVHWSNPVEPEITLPVFRKFPSHLVNLQNIQSAGEKLLSVTIKCLILDMSSFTISLTSLLVFISRSSFIIDSLCPFHRATISDHPSI